MKEVAVGRGAPRLQFRLVYLLASKLVLNSEIIDRMRVTPLPAWRRVVRHCLSLFCSPADGGGDSDIGTPRRWRLDDQKVGFDV